MTDVLKRALLHLPVGLIQVAICYANLMVGLCFCLGFLLYERNEDRHLQDQAWKDILGYLWGVGIGSAVLLVLKLCGII